MTAATPPGVALPFAAGSAIRRLHGEGVVLLGGGRALLMQLAEPRIARGVAEHSSFRRDRLARLLRTLRPMYAIAFGSREQALAAAASVNRLHESVAGDGYSARDQELLVWVLATLIDTTLVMHESFLPPLDPLIAAAYYEQMQRVGELLGIPCGAMPRDLPAFHGYVAEAVATLEVSPLAQELAAAIFRPRPGPWLGMWPLRQLTAGLLPPRLRAGFDLGWGPGRDRTLDLTASLSRRVLPAVPKRWRGPPAFLLPR
ncbi:MAG: DUF2236 domain-containing protein [Dehalococcoidia bacterium]|nr:DUF2236 domain-containing protein [Dehalococcoidia bacterium]